MLLGNVLKASMRKDACKFIFNRRRESIPSRGWRLMKGIYRVGFWSDSRRLRKLGQGVSERVKNNSSVVAAK